MSTNLAAVAEAITDTVPAVPFINWQYVYCWIISLFGAKCNSNTPTVDVPSVEGVGDAVVDGAVGAGSAVGDAASGAANAATDPGFWSWLWPFGSSGSDAASVGGAASGGVTGDAGFSLVSYVPEPVLVLFNFIADVFLFLWSLFSALSYTASLLLLFAIIAALAGLAYIRFTEWSKFDTLPPRPSGKNFGWSRWQDLLDAAMSTEPKRWKDGILAADQMLGELLAKLGYVGDSTQVQLSRVPEGAFVTLPQAWEAHRVRNFVAQKNSNFILTQREAFRVMKLYEQVFEEFDFI